VASYVNAVAISHKLRLNRIYGQTALKVQTSLDVAMPGTVSDLFLYPLSDSEINGYKESYESE